MHVLHAIAPWEVLGRKTNQCLLSRNRGLGDSVSDVAGQSYYSLQIYGGEMSMYGHRFYGKVNFGRPCFDSDIF